MSLYENLSRGENHYVGDELEQAYSQAQKLIESSRINMDDFVPPYDINLVEADKVRVGQMERDFKERESRDPDYAERKHASLVLEAVVSDQINNSSWFGGNARMIHTSKYDDFIGKVDGVIGIKETASRDSFFALGIDVTFSAHLEKKMGLILSELEKGQMASIKYFRSPDGGFKGELVNIPRIILGADANTVSELSRQWTDGNDALKKHWLQYQLLDMAIEQCDVFEKFAAAKGFHSGSEAYRRDGTKLKSIRTLKQKLASYVPTERDHVYHNVKNYLRLIKI